MHFVPLQRLMDLGLEKCADNPLKDAFASFSCQKDRDIENFAKERVLEFEKISKSRTYLFIDAEALKNKEIQIIAFFSLAMQILELPENLSVRQIKKLDGFSGKARGEKIKFLPVFLIGQLAKNDYFSDRITGNYILDRAIATTGNASKIVGGRIITVDVKYGESKLIAFYKRNGFKIVNNDSEAGFTQMIYML